jgi:hypothetical protein
MSTETENPIAPPADAAPSAPASPTPESPGDLPGATAAAGARPAASERGGSEGRERGDRVRALRRLLELAVEHPEIAGPLAEVAFATGDRDIAEQAVKLASGQGGAFEGLLIAATAARREKRFEDLFELVARGLDEYLAAEGASDEDGGRLMHLCRLGFSALLFDLRDVHGSPVFTAEIVEKVPALAPRLGHSAFYRTVLAQTLWYTDRDASEREWDRAAELDDPETTWNARGTWYNDADKDLERAERAYRRGLGAVPTSALLMHNVAQVLLEKARRAAAADHQRRLLNQATELLRAALRQDAPRLRRHIHATRDRVEELRRTLPAPPPREGAGERGRERTGRPDRRGEGRDGRGRRGGERQVEPPPGQKFLAEGTVSLGELLQAKLKGPGG